MAMTKGDKELMDEKFRGLSILINGINDKMEVMISKQDTTNGRVNRLEDNHILNGEQHKALTDILVDIKDTLGSYKKRNIGFWLYFSEKPMRLITLVALITGAVVGLNII